MNIFVITGSPHRHGSSDLLAERFIQGAIEARHKVERFDAAFANLHPCLGCDRCGMNGKCVQKDDMGKVLEKLLSSDLVALVTPLYYFGMSAQLKILLDRFYAVNGQIQSKRMQSVFLSVCWNGDEESMAALKHHYDTLCGYLNWQDRGAIYGLGCGTRSMTAGTPYPELAHQLGRSL